MTRETLRQIFAEWLKEYHWVDDVHLEQFAVGVNVDGDPSNTVSVDADLNFGDLVDRILAAQVQYPVPDGGGVLSQKQK